MTEEPQARGRLARVIATRGGLAPPEAPFVIEHREALIYLLCQAAELEHGIMCQYLYAVFSLKQSRIRGPQPARSSRRPALAQEDLPRRDPGDAAPVPGAEPAGRHRRRPAPVPAELPAPRQPLPRGRAPGPDPVRRAGAASLHVPRAPRGHGPRGRRGDDRPRLRPARDAGGRHRAPGPGLRHRRAPVPVHRGGHRAPGRQVRRPVAVRRPAAGAGHPAVLRLARADRGDRRGLGAAGHRRDPGAG